MPTRRGIYLVANQKSQLLCENLIYSIRQSGCALPIRVIHYGGQPVTSTYVLSEATLVYAASFPAEGLALVERLKTVLTDCPGGFLNRFLAWFGEFDEFIYSDNDIVALMNWEKLFAYIPDRYLVHADEEYKTEGRFNHNQPGYLQSEFGPDALGCAFTAGHFVSVKSEQLIADIDQAIEWFKAHPDVSKKHDQALLHVAALLGRWPLLNLCKPPHNWLTTWASDYPHSLAIIQAIQQGQSISHLHYSGRTPDGTHAVDDLLLANLPQTQRLNQLMRSGFHHLIHLDYMRFQKKRVKRVVKQFFR